MDKLKFNTKISLYPAFEVEITSDGETRVFQTRKLTRAFIREIEPIEASISKKDPEGIPNWVKLMFGIPEEILDQLEADEIEDIYLDTSKKFRARLKDRMDKNLDDLASQVEGFKDTERKMPANTIPGKATEKKRKNPTRPGAKK